MTTSQVGMTHRFQVRIDNTTYELGSWSKVSGLNVQWARITYRAGENNDTVVIPGNVSYSTIKLSRAACSDSDTVQKWLVSTSRQHQPLSGAIVMIGHDNKTAVITWELKRFFPIGWSISDFDSSSSRAAIENLELAHTGFLHDEAGR